MVAACMVAKIGLRTEPFFELVWLWQAKLPGIEGWCSGFSRL